MRTRFCPPSLHSRFALPLNYNTCPTRPFLYSRSTFLSLSNSAPFAPRRHLTRSTRQPPPPPARTLANLKKGLNLTALGTSVVVAAVAYFVWQGYASSFLPAASSDSASLDSTYTLPSAHDFPPVRVYPGMPAELGPGRPGNLTVEQSAKLKELWELLHQISSPAARRSSTADTNGSIRAPSLVESSPNSTKKKSRFGSIMGRKKDKDATSDTQSDFSVGSASTADDKHGQNKEFREALSKMSPDELREALWEFSKADDPDANLCRYLRARKWVVRDALVMLISTIHWRKRAINLDGDIMKYSEEAAVEAINGNDSPLSKDLSKDFMAQCYMGKSFMHGTDKEGRPMCFVRVRLHHGGDQSVESLERYTVWTIETARFMLRPPVDTAVLVFDMTGFSMANMDYTPVKFMIKVFEANYPESLGYVFVHRAPWIFQGVWRLIRGWLDPVVASKIHFTSNAKELSQHVDMDKIPRECGGEEDWEYKYVEPTGAENEAMKDTATKVAIQKDREVIIDEFERNTEEWLQSPSPTVPEPLAAKRLELAQKLRENYWRLDPYIRQRTLYDRIGIIQGKGYVNMYPDTRPDDSESDGESIYYDAVSEQQ